MTDVELIKLGVAQKAYPQYLYKYRADNHYTENIITQNELWFADPSLFNDPFDCNTPINPHTPLAEIKKWLLSVGILKNNIDRLAEEIQRNPNIMKDQTEKALKRTGVCCFSSLEDNILQWSHYSDYHQGVCLKFDVLENPDFFVTPIIVSYRRVMQHYNHFTHAQNIIEYLIRPKYYEWSYESEVRIVKPEPLINANGNQRAFKFKNEALKEIIFGAKASTAVIDKYKKLCKDNNKNHVQFFRMALGDSTHYELIKHAI